MANQQLQIFVKNSKFAKRNKDTVQTMFSPEKIKSNGWTCIIFSDGIKCYCKRKEITGEYIFRLNKTGNWDLSFVNIYGKKQLIKSSFINFKKPDSIDCVLLLCCTETPDVFIRPMEEQHVFEKHHFSVHMCQDPNGVYDIQSYISPTSQEYKKVYTDGKVVTVIHKDIEAKNGNGKFKDMEGHVVVSGANYVIYRCKHHYKNTESLCSDVLISKHTVLEVDELIKNQLEKQRNGKNKVMAST